MCVCSSIHVCVGCFSELLSTLELACSCCCTLFRGKSTAHQSGQCCSYFISQCTNSDLREAASVFLLHTYHPHPHTLSALRKHPSIPMSSLLWRAGALVRTGATATLRRRGVSARSAPHSPAHTHSHWLSITTRCMSTAVMQRTCAGMLTRSGSSARAINLLSGMYG
jgi:hypothetical protein